MPAFRLQGSTYYFAHVPKCGGTTVEQGLQDTGLTLSLLDQDWWGPDTPDWNRTSPQHITREALSRLFAPDFFDHCFACVRDPVERLLSAFNFNRGLGRLPRRQKLTQLLSQMERNQSYFENSFDNHFLPADRFIPHGCKVFRIEDGLDQVASWLGQISNGSINASFGHHQKSYPVGNREKDFVEKILGRFVEPDAITRNDLESVTLERIRSLYQVDYQRFY